MPELIEKLTIPAIKKVKAWSNMLIGGTKNCPMHLHPFTLDFVALVRGKGKGEGARPGDALNKIDLFWDQYLDILSLIPEAQFSFPTPRGRF